MLTVVFWNIKSERVFRKGENVAPDRTADPDMPETDVEESEEKADRRDIAEPRRSAVLQVIERMARQNNVDVFLLAECPLGFVKSVLDGLASVGAEFEDRMALFANKKVRALVRRPVIRLQHLDTNVLPGRNAPDFDEDLYDHYRLTQLRLTDPNNKDLLLLCAVHLVDKSRHNRATQREEARRIVRRIRFTEKRIVKQFRTMVTGDFNMDPFEEGMVLPDCFHSVASRLSGNRRQEVALEAESAPSRSVQGRLYPFFHNATWSLWGDDATAPVGTYYFDSGSNHILPRWHMFDQLLLRPDAMPLLVPQSLRILTHLPPARELGYERSLSLVRELPNPRDAGKYPDWRPAIIKQDKRYRVKYSDHLPLIFRIKD